MDEGNFQQEDDGDPDIAVDDTEEAATTTRHGPKSLHLPGLPARQHEFADPEKEELAFLRVENALLQKKLKHLERIARGEERRGTASADEAEMDRIDQLLQQAKAAKEEAINYVANTSREKLSEDVKVLQAILHKAKMERRAFKKMVQAAEDKLQVESARMQQEGAQYQVDRQIFTKMLQDDRDAYRREVSLLMAKVEELHKDKHALFVMAQEQQQRHLQVLRKLTRALARTKRVVEEQRVESVQVLQSIQGLQQQVVLPQTDHDAIDSEPAGEASSIGPADMDPATASTSS